MYFILYICTFAKENMLFPRNILDFFLQILCLFLNERNICFNLEGNKCIYIISKVFTELYSQRIDTNLHKAFNVEKPGIQDLLFRP